MALPVSSRYTRGGDDSVHKHTAAGDFCATRGADCWRDWQSTEPLLWDFYRNAISQPDQLRQRVAFALQQIVVVSGIEVSGTYGFRKYHNDLMDLSFGNYRDVLRKVTLSPLMGDFLNNANNDKDAPNENYARELLQLFSIGTCELEADGALKTGKCVPTYDNETVRSYAYALTGWTYPAGGVSRVDMENLIWRQAGQLARASLRARAAIWSKTAWSRRGCAGRRPAGRRCGRGCGRCRRRRAPAGRRRGASP